MKTNEYHVWFGIHGFDCTPDELTQQLGIKPTRTRVKGETRMVGNKKPRPLENKQNQWMLDSNLSRSVNIEEHIENILAQIRPNKANFIKVCNLYYSELGIAPYYYDANPGMHLSSEVINELSELHANVDIDIYSLGDINT